MLRPRVLLGPAALLGLLATTAPAADPSAPIDFVRDVRPILADKCFACHGPDESKREAGLRLDVPESALAELESGARAIVPSQPDESELVFRITTDDEELPWSLCKASPTANASASSNVNATRVACGSPSTLTPGRRRRPAISSSAASRAVLVSRR